ncbi:hypothetical protein EVAR_90154_1 [Eumeta japonica]|uniref:Uncharacterized protein n=1 Tax=Eumeta variegata TaxID=151549 RepID=A0A4C1Z8N8_EUMVA|nr:hypothetical protein EVAR_90154_1 [Eumeta japonica]
MQRLRRGKRLCSKNNTKIKLCGAAYVTPGLDKGTQNISAENKPVSAQSAPSTAAPCLRAATKTHLSPTYLAVALSTPLIFGYLAKLRRIVLSKLARVRIITVTNHR